MEYLVTYLQYGDSRTEDYENKEQAIKAMENELLNKEGIENVQLWERKVFSLNITLK